MSRCLHLRALLWTRNGISFAVGSVPKHRGILSETGQSGVLYRYGPFISQLVGHHVGVVLDAELKHQGADVAAFEQLDVDFRVELL